MRTIAYMVAVAAAVLLPAAGASAQESAALPFLNVPVSPRTASMGGVSSGMAPSAYAQFDNVAAVPFLEGSFSAGASYGLWQPSSADNNMIALGGIYNIGDRFGVTFGALAGINASYGLMDASGADAGRFTPKDFKIGAGISYRFMDNMSAGLALNYARSVLAPKSDLYKTSFDTFVADIQIMYRLDDFSFSLSGNNLGVPVKSASGTGFSLPMNAELSAVYENDFERHHVSAGIEGGVYFGGPAAGFGSVGAEYMYNSIIGIRAGYHYGSEKNGIPSFASAGLGFRFCGVNIDAAYLIAGKDSPMKNTFSVGIGYSF